MHPLINYHKAIINVNLNWLQNFFVSYALHITVGYLSINSRSKIRKIIGRGRCCAEGEREQKGEKLSNLHVKINERLSLTRDTF